MYSRIIRFEPDAENKRGFLTNMHTGFLFFFAGQYLGFFFLFTLVWFYIYLYINIIYVWFLFGLLSFSFGFVILWFALLSFLFL